MTNKILNKLGEGAYGKVYLVSPNSERNIIVTAHSDELTESVKKLVMSGETVMKRFASLGASFFPALRELDITSMFSGFRYTIAMVSVVDKIEGPILSPFDKKMVNADSHLLLEKGDYTFLEWYLNRDKLYQKSDRELLISHLKLGLLHIAAATAQLHHSGIVYRDMKPDNMMVFIKCSDHVSNTKICKNCDFRVKLIDFGLSAFEIGLMEDRQIFNIYFKPPECLGEKYYSYPADIWAYGCCIYSLIFDEFPFKLSEKMNDNTAIKYVLSNRVTDCTVEDLAVTVGADKPLRQMKDNSFPKSWLTEDELPDFLGLLKLCLHINPEKRIKAIDILDDKLFSDIDEEIEIIDINRDEEPIIITDSIERNYMMTMINRIYKKSRAYSKTDYTYKYNIRALCQAIRIVNICANNMAGAVIDKTTLKYYVYSALYLSYKLTSDTCKYKHFFSMNMLEASAGTDAVDKFAAIEDTIINQHLLKSGIYRKFIYECSIGPNHKADISKVKRAIKLIIAGKDVDGKLPSQVLTEC